MGTGAARLGAAVALTAAAGCGGDPATGGSAPPATPACAPPSRVVADQCRAPSVGDDGCPAGTLGAEDGSCLPAGIPPEKCPAGFAHDGGQGCDPILPPEPCAPGLMALPGETACRPVTPCASGKWGDIPIEAGTLYVDGSYPGGDSDGSASKPWTTIGDAYEAASAGTLLAVASGSYAEDIVIEGKPVRLWGLCPSEVEITGSASALATIFVRGGASGSEVHRVALRGGANGLVLTGSEDVVLEGLWVHDNASRGIQIEDTLGITSATIHGSLFEGNHVIGLSASASEVTAYDIAVRDTKPTAAKDLGIGIGLVENPGTGAPSVGRVTNVVLERNRGSGLYVVGSEATIETVVIRDTALDKTGNYGHGLDVFASQVTGAPSVAEVSGVVSERNGQVGMRFAGSNVTVDAAVVRDTLVDEVTGFGRGLQIEADAITANPSVVSVKSSLVERSYAVGVVVSGSEAHFEATVVRATQVDANGAWGRGFNIQPEPLSASPSTVFVTGSVIEGNAGVGLMVGGSVATLVGTVVRDTQANAEGSGRGINVQSDNPGQTDFPTAVATIQFSLVERSHELGICVIGASATLEGSLVRETSPRPDGTLGDGIFVGPDLRGAEITLTSSSIEQSARAGLSVFGATASLGSTTIQCSAFDLEGENAVDVPFELEDRGDNACGCPAVAGACQAISAGLTPPQPLGVE